MVTVYYTIILTGLILAAIAAEMFSAPQPALLYLVPCTLIPFVVKAAIQVDTPCMMFPNYLYNI